MSKTTFHIPPKGGWKPKTYYVVEVSFVHGNPIHERIFYTGFLDKNGNPAGYNKIFDSEYSIGDYKYLRAIREIDMSIPNKDSQIKDLEQLELIFNKTNY